MLVLLLKQRPFGLEGDQSFYRPREQEDPDDAISSWGAGPGSYHLGANEASFISISAEIGMLL